MSLLIWVEPNFALTPWYGDFLAGLKASLYAKRLKAEPELLEEPHAIDASDAMVVLVGETLLWHDTMLTALKRQRAHVCVASCEIASSGISAISTDHKRDMFNMVRFMRQARRERIALFGFNPSSPQDGQRMEGFLQAIETYSLPLSRARDVYLTSGEVSHCADRLLEHIRDYDAVITGNDLYALYLISRLRELNIRIPEDVYLASFGNTCLSRISRPSLSSMSVNLYQVAEMVVSSYLLWKKAPAITQYVILLESTFYSRQSTGGVSAQLSKQAYPYERFDAGISSYLDSKLLEMVQLETFIAKADTIDLMIVRALLDELSFDSLADRLYLSDRALDYRLSKMYRHFSLSSRQALVALFRRFEKFIRFPDPSDADWLS